MREASLNTVFAPLVELVPGVCLVFLADRTCVLGGPISDDGPSFLGDLLGMQLGLVVLALPPAGTFKSNKVDCRIGEGLEDLTLELGDFMPMPAFTGEWGDDGRFSAPLFGG